MKKAKDVSVTESVERQMFEHVINHVRENETDDRLILRMLAMVFYHKAGYDSYLGFDILHEVGGWDECYETYTIVLRKGEEYWKIKLPSDSYTDVNFYTATIEKVVPVVRTVTEYVFDEGSTT